MGNKNAAMARVFEADKQIAKQVQAALTQPSLCDTALNAHCDRLGLRRSPRQ